MADPFNEALSKIGASSSPKLESLPTLPASASTPSLQGGTTSNTGTSAESPTLAPQSEPEAQPANPAPKPVLPEPVHPEAKAPAAPDIKPHEFHLPPKPTVDYSTNYPAPAQAKSSPNLLDMIVKPLGQFGAGFIGGGVSVADQAKAGASAIPQLLGAQPPPQSLQQAISGKNPYDSWQENYEHGQAPGTVESPAYQVGNAVGQTGAYIGGGIAAGAVALSAGVSAPVTAGAAALGALGEGALIGFGQSAQEQLKGSKTGKIDKGQLAADTAWGAGTALAVPAIFAGGKKVVQAGVAKYAKGVKEAADKAAYAAHIAKVREAQAAAQGRTFREAHEARVRKLIEEQAAKSTQAAEEFLGDVADTLQNMEAEQINNVEKAFSPPPPNSPLQRKQRQAMAEAQGQFRYRKFGHGFENIEHGKLFADIEQHLSKETAAKLKEALDLIAKVRAAKDYAENEVEAYGKRAAELAHDAAEKAKVIVKTGVKFNSKGQAQYDKKRIELLAKQQAEQAAKKQAEHDALIGQIATASKKQLRDLHTMLAAIDEQLQRLLHPEHDINIPDTKHLYVIADRSHFRVKRPMPSNFNDAFKGFEESVRLLKAAETQFTDAKAVVQHIFEAAEKEFQAKIGTDQERLWIQHPMQHPSSPLHTTAMGIGLQYDRSFGARLEGMYAKELKVALDELQRIEGNVSKEIAYDLGLEERLGVSGMKKADKTALLKEKGLLHPVTKKLLLAAVFGSPALDLNAEASDVHKHVNVPYFFSGLAFAVGATILAAKFGPAGARKVITSPAYRMARHLSNTRDLAKLADESLKTLGNTTQSLSYKMESLGALMTRAIRNCPDDAHYLLASVRKKVDPKLLSDTGKTYLAAIQDEAKALKSFINEYDKRWSRHYDSLSDADKAIQAGPNEAVKFLYNALHPHKNTGNPYDLRLGKLMGNAAATHFTWNPGNWIANVMDIAINGPLKIGPGATANALLAYNTNPVLKGLLSKVRMGGNQTQLVQDLAPNIVRHPLPNEVAQGRLMTLASLFHYFHTNPRDMKHLGIKSQEEFAKRFLTEALPDDVLHNAYIQLHVDLVDTVGFDPVGLTLGPWSRGQKTGFMRYIAQPERYARLAMTNVANGNLKWIAASIAAIWQAGGHAAIPKTLQMAGWALAPTDTAKLFAWLDMTSIGMRVYGDISGRIDWDPKLFYLMGTQNPGFQQGVDLLADIPHAVEQINSLISAVAHGGKAFVSDPRNEKNKAAQKGLHNIISLVALAFPMVSKLPTTAGALQVHLPEVLHGRASISTPRPGLGRAFPLEPSQEVRYHPHEREPKENETLQDQVVKALVPEGNAVEDSVRRSLRAPDSLAATLYKDAETGIKLGGEDKFLRSVIKQTGIHRRSGK